MNQTLQNLWKASEYPDTKLTYSIAIGRVIVAMVLFWIVGLFSALPLMAGVILLFVEPVLEVPFIWLLQPAVGVVLMAVSAPLLIKCFEP